MEPVTQHSISSYMCDRHSILTIETELLPPFPPPAPAPNLFIPQSCPVSDNACFILLGIHTCLLGSLLSLIPLCITKSLIIPLCITKSLTLPLKHICIWKPAPLPAQRPHRCRQLSRPSHRLRATGVLLLVLGPLPL